MKQILLITLLFTANTLFSQNYQFLGKYTSDGTPLYLESERDDVSAATLELISSALPESYPVPGYNPHYISSGYDTDISITAPADVCVTFVQEGAGYRNVLVFFTYPTGNPPASIPSANDITIIFPNVSAKGSGGSLLAGDKVKIGTFAPGTSIGWVLLAVRCGDFCTDEKALRIKRSSTVYLRTTFKKMDPCRWFKAIDERFNQNRFSTGSNRLAL